MKSNDVFIGIFSVSLLIFLAVMVVHSFDLAKECKQVGGVMVSGKCVKQECVIEVKK